MRADNSVNEYYQKLEAYLTSVRSLSQLYQAIPDAPFQNKFHTTTLDLGVVVLLLVDKKTNTINRITYSNTEPGRMAVNASAVPFHMIKIPLDDKLNISAKAIRFGKPFKTSDWSTMFTPALTPQAARFNQAESGMDCSFIYPLLEVKNGGALIFSFYQPMQSIGAAHQRFMKRYSDMVANILATQQ